MAYSVNWVTKVLTIPTADLTLVSGTRYKLLMSDFLAECRRLEWAFTEGLWAPPILDHSNTRVDFAGVDYAPFDEVVNGYTAQITGVATRVDLLGSNNNIIDVLIATGVSVVPNNSAGLQLVSVGSGVTEQDKTDIITGVTGSTIIIAIRNMVRDIWKLRQCDSSNPVTNTPTSTTVDDITIEHVGDPETSITSTRI